MSLAVAQVRYLERPKRARPRTAPAKPPAGGRPAAPAAPAFPLCVGQRCKVVGRQGKATGGKARQQPQRPGRQPARVVPAAEGILAARGLAAVRKLQGPAGRASPAGGGRRPELRGRVAFIGELDGSRNRFEPAVLVEPGLWIGVELDEPVSPSRPLGLARSGLQSSLVVAVLTLPLCPAARQARRHRPTAECGRGWWAASEPAAVPLPARARAARARFERARGQAGELRVVNEIPFSRAMDALSGLSVSSFGRWCRSCLGCRRRPGT